MTPEAARELTEGLGQTLGGGWRLVLWGVREGVPEALGLTTEGWVAELGGYVKLPAIERREVSRELVKSEGLTQREAGEVLGVDHATVHRDLAGADAPPPPPDQDERPASGADAPPDPERAARDAQRAAEAEAKRREAVARQNVDKALVLLDPLRLDPEHRAEQWAGYLAGHVDVAALRRALAVLEALVARLDHPEGTYAA